MGKKKAAGKPAHDETDEQRAVRMQMEALVAEEKARTQAELSRIELRSRQIREQHYGHINSMKIHHQWRRIMRAAKVEDLRKEIEIISQNHEREVDRMDALVQLLDRDLEEAEEQHQAALRAHLIATDSLLGLQATRLTALEAQFNGDLSELQAEFAAERTEVMSSHARTKKELQDMAEAMKVEFADAEADARQEYESAREEVRNRSSEEYNVLKLQLEGIIEELERHFEQAHRTYLDSTEHRTASFKTLTANDAAAAKVIEQRMRKLEKLQEELTHWRTKIASSGREWDERNAALRREKELMGRHYAQLRSTLDNARGAAAARLRDLSVTSAARIQELSARIAKAESVLRLGEMCRKLETEQEKVLCFGSLPPRVTLSPELQKAAAAAAATALQAQEQQQQQTMQTTEQLVLPAPPLASPASGLQPDDSSAACCCSDSGGVQVRGMETSPSSPLSPPARLQSVGVDEDGREVEDGEYLNRFYRRYNKAMMDVAAVDRERARLGAENAGLRGLLKGYLDGISIDTGVMDTPCNPLLVVNSKLQVMLEERRKACSSPRSGGALSATEKALLLSSTKTGGLKRAAMPSVCSSRAVT